MFLDPDGFKAVNDHFGHGIGDLLLKEVGRRMTSCIQERNVVARIGGDEFTIFFSNIRDEEEIVGIAKSIINEVGSP